MTETMTGAPPAAGTTGAGARVGALRRGAAQSQRDFTTLLDVLARPGKIGRLDVPAELPAAAAAACGLVDVEVSLHVLTADGGEGPGWGRAWGDAVHAATNAPRSELALARTVLALRPMTVEEIGTLRRGDALNPEQGARLFSAVEALTAGTGGDGEETVLTLTGPGVPGERRVGVRGLSVAVIEALREANSGFPLGVDTFLVARDGAVTGLPRTTQVAVTSVGG